MTLHPPAPSAAMLSAKDRMLEWRRGRPRTPPLERLEVEARGLSFAVWRSPAIAGGLPPLLAINGGLIYGHDLLWPAFAPFAESRQVILYDQRGRGETPAPPGLRAARIEHDVLDVPALREALSVAQWDLAGHSWGGGIALLAAAADPVGVRRVVTFDAVGATSGWLHALHERALAHLAARNAHDAHAALQALDPITLHTPDAARLAEYSRTMYPAWFHDQGMMIFAPPLAESATGSTIAARLRREGYDWRETLRTVGTPTLLIHGEADAIPIAEAERTAGLIAGARVVPIPSAGHMPFFENPEPSFGAALGFLEASQS